MQPRLVSVPRFAVGLLALALCALETGCRKRAAELPAPLTPVAVEVMSDGPPLSVADEQALTLMLQGAVSEFFKQHKRYPKTIAELQAARLLEIIPNSPPGRKFVISPTDGRFSILPK